MKLFLLAITIGLSGCTTCYYPNGKKLCAIGSNVAHVHIKTAEMDVTLDGVDNAIIHKTAGDTVNKTGVAVATSGLFGFLGPLLK